MCVREKWKGGERGNMRNLLRVRKGIGNIPGDFGYGGLFGVGYYVDGKWWPLDLDFDGCDVMGCVGIVVSKLES